MSSYSKTIIVGHLGRAPETRYTPGGKNVTDFSVAVSKAWTDANGDKQEKTDWYKVTTWGKLAEICQQYLDKGRQVLVEGEVSASAWTDKEGNPRATLELNAREVRFLGGAPSNGDEKPAAKPAAKPQTKAAPAPDYDEEDIPF